MKLWGKFIYPQYFVAFCRFFLLFKQDYNILYFKLKNKKSLTASFITFHLNIHQKLNTSKTESKTAKTEYRILKFLFPSFRFSTCTTKFFENLGFVRATLVLPKCIKCIMFLTLYIQFLVLSTLICVYYLTCVITQHTHLHNRWNEKTPPF